MNNKAKKKSLKKFKVFHKYLSKRNYIEARNLLEEILKKEVVSKENWSHCYNKIFPMIAIYKCLQRKEKDAFEQANSIFHKHIYPEVNSLRKIMKIPFVYKLVPRMVLKIIKIFYKESVEGFQIDILETNKDICRFNIKQCPYYNYCKKWEVPELCEIFCSSDDLTGDALKPNIIFERTMTLSRKDPYCDFCYHFKK